MASPDATICWASSAVPAAATSASRRRTVRTTASACAGFSASGFAVTSAASALPDCGAAPAFSALLSSDSVPGSVAGSPAMLAVSTTALPSLSSRARSRACNMLPAAGTTMALAYWSSAWATASSQPSATWMKSVSRPSEATSVSRSNDPEALRLPSVSASASALDLSEMILDCISRCLSARSFSRSRHSASVARAASNAAPSSSAMESASLRNASSCCWASSRWEVSESRWEA